MNLKKLADIIPDLENEDLKILDIVCAGSSVDEKHKSKKNVMHGKIKEEMHSRGLKTSESQK
jgi:hypothetical protein